jgi:hypothetical protein
MCRSQGTSALIAATPRATAQEKTGNDHVDSRGNMTYQPTLQATPNVVIIDIEAGQTDGTTQIEYSKEHEHTVWHRWKSGAWLRVSLQVTAPDDPALAHGYFASPKLEPGWVYQVAIWDRGVDPNRLPNVDIPIRALAAITVFALRKRPERRGFFSDESQRTGGTYREHQVATTVPVYAYMEVSTGFPQMDGEGYQSFSHADGTTWAPLNQSFLLQVFDLLPGTHYHELVRLSDAFGNWEFLSREFTTLKRRIRLQPTDLFINDDSDDFSNGEGSFEFTLQNGNITQPSSWQAREKLTYANGNLETGKSVTPAPSGEIVVGPERVVDEMRHVRLRVFGQEDDSNSFPAEGDDFAWASKDLLLPTGTTDEIVSHRPDAILADSNDDLRFTLSFKYWIEYF